VPCVSRLPIRYDLEADVAESNDLAQDPKYKLVVAQLAARLEAAAATGPPWAWPLTGKAEQAVKDEMCASAAATGFFEPLRDDPFPPGPPPPPPPGPPPGPLPPALMYERGGKCLVATPLNKSALVLGDCGTAGALGLWRAGVVRGVPSLENVGLQQHAPVAGYQYCIHIGVYPNNMTCRTGPGQPGGNSHTPGVRQCINDRPATPGHGGNPVGCGFQYVDGVAGGVIKSLSCKDEAGMCLGAATETESEPEPETGAGAGAGGAFAIVPCDDARALGWSAQAPRL